MADIKYQLEIIRSKNRHRTITLKIENERLIVLAPQDLTDKQLNDVLIKKANWIEKQLKKTANYKNSSSHIIAYGHQVFYQGVLLTLAENRASEEIFICEAKLYVPAISLNKEALYTWYRGQSELKIPSRVHTLCENYQFSLANLHLKDQKKRWGSCSSLKNINLSWRLILLPLWVSDYIIIHELCHLKQPNHSPEFWSLVARYFPKYQLAKQYLKENETALISFLT